MILKKLQLKDVRCHEHLVIDFPTTGTIGIVGRNEAGKSTIFEAIHWALYGQLVGSVGSLGRRGGDKPSVRLEVEFRKDGDTLVIERGPGHAQVVNTTCENVFASGIRPVNAYLENRLGMAHEEFATSYLASQGDIRRMITMRPAERAAFVRRVLGVEIVDDTLKTLRREHRDANVRLEALSDHPVDIDKLKATLQREQEALESQTATEEVLETAHRSAMAKASNLEQRRDALQEKVQRIAQSLFTTNSDWEAGKAALRRKEDLGDHIAVLTKKLPDKPLPNGEYAEEIPRLREAVKNALANWEYGRGQAQASYTELNNALSSARKQLGSGICPTCEREWDDRAAREMVVEKLEEDLAEVTKQLDTARTKPDGLVQLETQLAGYLASEKVYKTALDDFQRKKATIDHHSETLRGITVPHLGKFAATIESLETEQGAAQKEFDEQDVAFKRARKESSDKLSELHEIREMLQRTRVSIQYAEKAVADAQRQIDSAAKARNEAKIAAAAENRMADFRSLIVGSIRPDLEELTSGFVSLLTDGRHEAVTLDGSLTPTIYESGQPSEVVSGGTLDVVGLSMRLALGQMLASRTGSPIQCLLLDEPFGSLDAVRRQNVMTLLKGLQTEYQQVVMISHVEETRDFVDVAVDLDR